MTARISGAIFLALVAYVLAGWAFFDVPDTSAGMTASGMIGLSWFVAVWAALVAAMVFLIAWTGAAVKKAEAEIEAERLMQQAVPANKPHTMSPSLAKAS